MSAIATALERGREHAKRYQPVDVEHRGRLVARVRDTKTDRVEGVYEQGGSYLYYGVGLTRDGKHTVNEVRGGELKKVARAMLHGPHRDELIREAFDALRERNRKIIGKSTRARRKH